jgi:tetratricopeptide (TPR) repeat protein
MKSTIGIARAAALVGMVALFAACSGKQERVDEHLKKGDVYLQQEDLEKARVEYKNVLQIDPKSVGGLHGMGLVMERQQNWRNAVGFYQRAVELDSAALPSKVRLARLYLLGGALDKAREAADQILVAQPNNADALTVKAGLAAREGDAEAAVKQAQAALAAQPDHEDAIMLVVGFHNREKRFDESIALLRDGIARKPKATALRAVLAQTYATQGDAANATDALRGIVAVEPEQLAHRVRLAEFLHAQKRTDEAEAALREAVATPELGVEAKLALANFLFTARGADVAERQLREFIAAEPKEHGLRFALARIHEAGKKSDEVKRVYTEIIDIDRLGRDGLRARSRLAALSFVENKPEEGDRLIAEVLKENSRDIEALMLRATRALVNKDTATAVADARTVLKDEPSRVEAALLLADAHVTNRENQLATEVLQSAIEASPRDARPRLALVKVLAQNGDIDKSMEQLKLLVASVPENAVAREALFKAYMQRGAITEARKVAEDVKRDFPQRALGAYLAGLSLQQQGEFAKSIVEFDAAIGREPQYMEFLLAVVKSHLALKQNERAQARVRNALVRFPDAPLLHNLLGEVLMVKNDLKGAEQALNKAIALNPKLAMPYRNLAAVRAAAGDRAGAISVYEQAVTATDNDPGMVFALAGALEALGETDRAIAQYESVLQKDPGSIAAANNLAMMLVTHRDDAASLDRAAKLIDPLRGSRNPAYLDTVGWVHYKRNDTQNAVVALDEAVRAAPEDPVLRYHLGMALFKKGDTVAAREHLARAVNAKRTFSGIDEARATLNRIAGSRAAG